MHVGQVISHYEILEELGHGAMGVVYKAVDTRLKRIVALKFLSVQVECDSEFYLRFLREAQTAAATEHRNINTVYEIGETEAGQSFIAMAFCEGRSLKQLLADSPLSIEHAMDIATQIADGLAAAHARGVVHRDIKPGNLMVLPDGTVKIVDFGLAKGEGLDEISRTGGTLGTIAYMSPEQIQREPVDHRTDIWSLGVVLFEMVAGYRPFIGEYEQVVAYSILTDGAPVLSKARDGVPASVESIVQRTLDKSPDRRYQRAADVASDLRMARREMQTPSAVDWRLLWRRTRRRVSAPPVTLLLLLALFAVSLLYLNEVRRTQEVLVPTQVTHGGEVSMEPAWSPDGKRLAYSSDEAGSLDIWYRDLESGTSVRLTSGDGDETHPTWSPDGQTIAYSADRDGIRMVSVTTGEDRVVHYGGAYPRYAHNSNRIVFEEHGGIWIADHGQVRRVVKATDGRSYPIWSPDDRKLIFYSRAPIGNVAVLDLESGHMETLHIVPAASEASGLALTPDARHLIVSMGVYGGKQRLWTVEMNPRNLSQRSPARRIFAETKSDVHPALSPDGRAIAFSVMDVQRHLWRYDLDPEIGRLIPSTGRRVTSEGRMNYYPAVSADGSTLVWTSHRQENGVLFHANPDSAHVPARRVTVHAGLGLREVMASLIPDGIGLVYASTQRKPYEIWHLADNTDAGRPLTKVSGSHGDGHPAASSDGRVAFYSPRRDGEADIWILPIRGSDGAEPELLLPDRLQGSHEMYPAWSVDNSQLAFTSDRSDSRDIWAYNFAADSLIQMTSLRGREVWPAYSPDGRFLYFTSDEGGRPNLWSLNLDDGNVSQASFLGDMPSDLLMTKFSVSDGAVVLPRESVRAQIAIFDLSL